MACNSKLINVGFNLSAQRLIVKVRPHSVIVYCPDVNNKGIGFKRLLYPL